MFIFITIGPFFYLHGKYNIIAPLCMKGIIMSLITFVNKNVLAWWSEDKNKKTLCIISIKRPRYLYLGINYDKVISVFSSIWLSCKVSMCYDFILMLPI